MSGLNYYFASDFHLGVPNHAASLEREKLIVSWLNEIEHDAKAIYLLGDLFDFWYEYRRTVPKGYVRLLGKLGELSDKGIDIIIFKGNHDMWMWGYLEKEIGATIISDELEVELHSKKIFMHHGDGLGPGDRSYKFLRNFIFRNKFLQFLYRLVPPAFGMAIASYFSSKSRLVNADKDAHFDEEKEWLLQYCKEKVVEKPYDYFIFGHRHLPLDLEVNVHSRYINLGEWVNYNSYAVLNENGLELKTFEK